MTEEREGGRYGMGRERDREKSIESGKERG